LPVRAAQPLRLSLVLSTLKVLSGQPAAVR
jgi:hypothetical protein